MPPKTQKKEVITPITGEDLEAALNPENHKLIIVDTYLQHWGPCSVMEPNFRTVYFEIEEAEKRIAFHTIEFNEIPEEIRNGLESPASVKPKFLVFLEGELKAEIEGADYTKIENQIKINLPGLDD